MEISKICVVGADIMVWGIRLSSVQLKVGTKS